jgi:hypothetical protein
MIRTSARQDSNFINEMFSTTLLEQAMQFIVDNFEPEDIFEEDVMGQWAEDNGYIKEE